MKTFWIAAFILCIALEPISAQDQTSRIELNLGGELNLVPSVLDEEP